MAEEEVVGVIILGPLFILALGWIVYISIDLYKYLGKLGKLTWWVAAWTVVSPILIAIVKTYLVAEGVF